jgi:hypothetical protein
MTIKGVRKISHLSIATLTCGVVMTSVSCAAALLGSALYRHQPEMFDNANKGIKNNVHSFFKPKPTSHPQNNNDNPPTIYAGL